MCHICRQLPNDSIKNRTISQLKALNFDLTDKGEVDSFLGIQIDAAEDETIPMAQPALATIIRLCLHTDSKQQLTHAVSPPLQKCEDSTPFKEEWSYRSLIYILTYLAHNTRPDIEYAVH